MILSEELFTPYPYVARMINIEQIEGDIDFTEKPLSLNEVIHHAFTLQSENWKHTMGSAAAIILNPLADYFLQTSTPSIENNSIQDNQYVEFAQLQGSVARKLFYDPGIVDQTWQVLADVAENMPKGSPDFVTSVLSGFKIGIHDIDIKLDPTRWSTTIPEVLDLIRPGFAQLIKSGFSVETHIYRVYEGMDILRVTLDPSDGSTPCNVDIAYLPTKDQQDRDFRNGDHLSLKKDGVYVNIAVDTSKESEDLGRFVIIDTFESLIKKIDITLLPSQIRNPFYRSFEQTVYALLSLIRQEIFNPAPVDLAERVKSATFDEVYRQLLIHNLIDVYKQKKLTEGVQIDIAREVLIALTANPVFAFGSLIRSGLPDVLGIQSDFVSLLGKMTSDEMQSRIKTDSVFVQQIIELFNIKSQSTLVDIPKPDRYVDLIPVGDSVNRATQLIFKDMHRVDTAPLSDRVARYKHHFHSWIIDTPETPKLMDHLYADPDDRRTANIIINSAALDSTVVMMPNSTRLFVFNQEQSRPPDSQNIKKLIQGLRVRPDIVQYYKKFMPDCVAAWEYQNLTLGAGKRHHLSLQLHQADLPLAMIRVMQSPDVGEIVVFSHPACFYPATVLRELQLCTDPNGDYPGTDLKDFFTTEQIEKYVEFLDQRL